MDFALPKGSKFKYVGDIVPGHLRQYLISDAQTHYKLFDAGEVLTQIILGSDYSILLHRFIILRKCKLLPISQEDVLAINYMMLGNISCNLRGFGPVLLIQGWYGLFYIPGKVHHQAMFKPGTYYCVQINFHPSLFKQVATQYPIFQPFLHLAENRQQKGKAQEQSVLFPYISDIIDQMLNLNLGIGERTLFTESQIRHLLRLYIRDQGMRSTGTKITPYQKLTLDKMEEYIKTHLDQDISVKAIAKACGKGKSWLHYTCKSYYGMGVHEVVTQRRMDAAAHLLLSTNMQVSDIASKVSSLNFSAFSAAFQKHFHQTPSAFRKNGEQIS